MLKTRTSGIHKHREPGVPGLVVCEFQEASLGAAAVGECGLAQERRVLHSLHNGVDTAV